MKVEFLTHKNISEDLVLETLIASEKTILLEGDREILSGLLKEFKRKGKAMLNSQEVRYLLLHHRSTWADYLIYRWKFTNYCEKKIVSAFPLYLLIEPTSICNVRCVMCFQTDKTFSSDKKYMGMMDLDLFKKIIDEAEEGGTKAITLASRGEPILHPKIKEMLAYCKGKFLELKLNTNGTRLDNDLIHAILKANVDILVFSIDSYIASEYENIRKKSSFDTIVQNIRNFKEIRDVEYPNSKCVTRVSCVRMNDDLNYDKFAEFWAELVDDVGIIECNERSDTYNNKLNEKLGDPCLLLWNRMYLWYDGVCNPCDIDYKSYLALGNVNDQSIRDLWHGEKYNEMRKVHLAMNRNSLEPCDRCFI